MRPALTVTAVAPRQVSMPVKLAANGNIMAWQEAIVGAEASGLRLTQVHVNVGDSVQQGPGAGHLRAATRFAPKSRRPAPAWPKPKRPPPMRRTTPQRARSLQGTGALSASQINQYLTAEKTAQGESRGGAGAGAGAAGAADPDRGATRPTAASSRRARATVGAVVGNGAELFRLIRQGRLEWRAEVTSSELGRITTGTTALVTAASGARLAGRVRMIGPTVDPQTRSALVYVDLAPLPGTSASARAGMFARGEFDLGATPRCHGAAGCGGGARRLQLRVPRQSRHRVSQVKVQTGRLRGRPLEIVSGLPADARVVAAGAGFLNDGDLVRRGRCAGAAPLAASGARQ